MMDSTDATAQLAALEARIAVATAEVQTVAEYLDGIATAFFEQPVQVQHIAARIAPRTRGAAGLALHLRADQAFTAPIEAAAKRAIERGELPASLDTALFAATARRILLSLGYEISEHGQGEIRAALQVHAQRAGEP